jgi:ribonuclease HII
VVLEADLLVAWGAPLVALDEVGRGAVAGPVSVGAVLLGAAELAAPVPAVRDSKLLSATARTRLAPQIRSWVAAAAVGHAAAAEIDQVGILAALQLAALRALAQLPSPPAVILLDGNLDWLSPPPTAGVQSLLGHTGGEVSAPVVCRVKADRDCASVAAASVLAKLERDAVLTDLAAASPGYGFEAHKGYLTRAHVEAIARLGPSVEHRRSWRLPPGPLGDAPSVQHPPRAQPAPRDGSVGQGDGGGQH